MTEPALMIRAVPRRLLSCGDTGGERWHFHGSVHLRNSTRLEPLARRHAICRNALQISIYRRTTLPMHAPIQRPKPM
jgi:hypothetical protein